MFESLLWFGHLFFYVFYVIVRFLKELCLIKGLAAKAAGM